MATRVCVRPPSPVDSGGLAIEPDCDPVEPSYFTGFTADQAVIGDLLVVATSNLASSAEGRFRPGTLLLFSFDDTGALDGAVLGDVDVLAGEHGVAPLGDAGITGDGDQRLQELVRDRVLRVVDPEVADLDDAFICSPWFGLEQLTDGRLIGQCRQDRHHLVQLLVARSGHGRSEHPAGRHGKRWR